MSAIASAEPSQQQAAPSGDAAFKAAIAAQVEYNNRGGEQQQEAPRQEAAPQQEQATQEQAPQQEAAKESSQGKNKWDALAKPKEAEKAKEAEQGADYDGDTPPTGDKAQSAWMQRKHKIKELEATLAQREQEWQKRQQEYEGKVKEYEGKITEVKPEDLQALKRYREEEAIFRIERTEEYQTKAQQPFQQADSVLSEVSEYTGISKNDIKQALLEKNSILRDEAVLALMEKSTKEMSDARKEALKNRVIEAGDKMQTAAQEHQRLMDNAGQKREQYELQTKAEQMKAQEEAKTALRASASEITDGMHAQLKELFEDGSLNKSLLDTMRNVEVPDSPMDRAFGEIAANLLGPITNQLWKLRAENEKLKEDAKARTKLNPSVRPGAQAQRQNGNKAPYASFEEAIAAQQRYNSSNGFGG